MAGGKIFISCIRENRGKRKEQRQEISCGLAVVRLRTEIGMLKKYSLRFFCANSLRALREKRREKREERRDQLSVGSC